MKEEEIFDEVELLPDTELDRDYGYSDGVFTFGKGGYGGSSLGYGKVKGRFSDEILGDYRDRIALKGDKKIAFEAMSVARSCVDIVNNTGNKIIIETKNNRKYDIPKTKMVKVNTGILKKKGIDEGIRKDTLVGEAIHETLHLSETKYPASFQSENDIIKMMANLIEDSRIEGKMLEDRPGYGSFLQNYKDFFYHEKFKPYFDKIKEKCDEQNKPKLKKATEIMEVIYKSLRFLDKMTEDELSDHNHMIKDILNILDDYQFKNTKESVDAAKEIYDHIFKNVEELEDEEGGIQDGMIDLMGNGNSEMFTDEVDGAIDFSNDVDEMNKTDEQKEITKIITTKDNFSAMPKVIWEKSTENKTSYSRCYDEIKPYIAAIARKLQTLETSIDLSLRSMRSGKFDTNKLADAYQGINTVYIKRATVEIPKLSVCLVIDESGSMSGSKIRSAQKTAILLYEAIRKLKLIDVYVYGHTADMRGGETHLNVYVENNKEVEKYALGSVAARANNRDGHAFTEIAKKMRTMTESDTLMIIISDGQPNASGYSGNSGSRHTKESIAWIEKQGITVWGIAIDGDIPAMREMYPKNQFFELKNMYTLATDVGSMMKRFAERKMKREIRF